MASPTDQYLYGRRGLLPRLVVLHVAILVILATWLFGGNAVRLRPLIALWGSLSLPLALWAFVERRRAGAHSWAPASWLYPLILLNAQVLASLLNPRFRELQLGDSTGLVPGGDIPWLPGSASPLLSFQALWLFDAIYLSGFNLLIAVRRRRHVRTLLALCGVNAIVLSVFGTFQQLTGADGLFFGRVPSPNPTFFATFIYHNHWAAFALLSLAVLIGLTWHAARQSVERYRDFLHSPAFLWLVGSLVIAGTIPLCGSRSGMLLLALLCLGGGVHLLLHLRRRPGRRSEWNPRMLAAAGTALAMLLAVTWLAGPVIRQRWEHSRLQLSDIGRAQGPNQRLVLYRDSLRLAADRPLFGWGMASYPVAFYPYNTQKPNSDRIPVFYADAHNDWIQALAEHGLVGCLLLVLCALPPLLSLRHVEHLGTLTRYLLSGCALVLLYALFEFPLGNPAVVLLWWILYFGAILYPRTD
jgi:O-antigen ligase